ncbi:hypothetical protein HYY69_08555 [Candidatus Woesearchaeota archaeon]|nr:hypothetical protein [Candidatus Woesearchaeota archaeon]
MVDREAVYQLVKLQGPLIPSQITSQLKSNTILIGAFLSELHSHDRVCLTHLKRGGSPYYYIKEQLDKLQTLCADLNEKDRRTFDVLKEKKLLEDTEVEPLTRVSLRNIKDFAVPIQATIYGQERLFWKWYLLSNEEVHTILEQRFQPIIEKKEPVAPQKQAVVKKQTPRKIKQEKLTNTVPEVVETSSTPSLPQEVSLQHNLEHDLVQDPFLEKICTFFKKNNIYIVTYTILQKKRDIEFVITVPSPVGGVEYYCRARSKKNNNENDLAMVYVVGESKKLPVLYITTGEITKKALNQLPVMFKNLKVKQL